MPTKSISREFSNRKVTRQVERTIDGHRYPGPIRGVTDVLADAGWGNDTIISGVPSAESEERKNTMNNLPARLLDHITAVKFDTSLRRKRDTWGAATEVDPIDRPGGSDWTFSQQGDPSLRSG